MIFATIQKCQIMQLEEMGDLRLQFRGLTILSQLLFAGVCLEMFS